ncbi:hypothetical protein [Micromonospora sp. NPDC092111]|uniref:hypothetical protein n=1 Tax=Micromonospora sp. NPDC092111 TaxID=3364289 RepID=UPI003825FC9B
MAFARKYPPDVITTAVRQVEAARAAGQRGPVSAVARDLHIDRRLLQDWVSRARAEAAPAAACPTPPRSSNTSDDAVLLPDGLLYCRICQQLMTAAFTCAGLVYDCPPPCRRTPLDAVAVAHTVGQVVLRHAAHLVPALTHPKGTGIAAAHAHRVLTRINAGTHPTDLRITWHPTAGHPRPALVKQLRLARQLATTDPYRAHTIVRDMLIGIDPTTTASDTIHAEAAHYLAHLIHGDAAIRWAEYAHRSLTHLHGPTAPLTLAATHTLATAHRKAGHHQRAYRLYHQLADQLAATAGPDAHQTLAVRATTALVLGDLGHRDAARTLLADTISHHRRAHPGHPATARMAEHLDRMVDQALVHAPNAVDLRRSCMCPPVPR